MVCTCAPLVVKIFTLGLAESTCWLVTTAGPSGVVTRKPVPSPRSPLMTTTACACASVRLPAPGAPPVLEAMVIIDGMDGGGAT